MTKTDEVWRINMRELRLQSGKSMGVLCESIGMSRRFWHDVENGLKEPSVSTLQRIAKALGVTVRDLLTERKGRKGELVGGRK